MALEIDLKIYDTEHMYKGDTFIIFSKTSSALNNKTYKYKKTYFINS